MALAVIQFISLFLLLLVTGVFWGPWLGLHRSLGLFSAAELIRIVDTMANNLAQPMRILMPCCLVFLSLSTWFYPEKESVQFYLSVASIVLMVAALVITLLVELPAVNQIRNWATAAIPEEWEAVRNRWVYFHVIRTFASLASFALFAVSILICL